MGRPIHAVFLGHVARFSGAEIEMLRVIGAAEGLDATVILAEDGPLVGALVDVGARVEVMPLNERARGLKRTSVQVGSTQMFAAVDVARYVYALRRRLSALQPDVVSAISLKAGAYGAVAARLARLPFVWHLHDQVNRSYLARQAVLPMRALIGTLPSAVIAPSRQTLDIVGWFRPGLRTGVIPCPTPIPASAVEIRPEVERVGIVGRLAPWKGQHIFLRAFAQAFRATDVRAVLVGNAMFGELDYESDLRELATQLGIANQVDFLGFRDDVEKEFRQLDLLVHASVLTEPGGTAIFEGMAAGLPVIAAASGAPAEYISNGENGLLHEPGDVDDLAKMMLLAAQDRDLRVRLAVAGRQRAREFSPEVVARAWTGAYSAVVTREDRVPMTTSRSAA